MSGKKFILNADDLGLSKSINKAVHEAYSYGLLKSTSLVANGEAFEDAVENVISECPELGVGIHLNITEGKSICKDLETLTDKNFSFNNSYLQLLIKAYNPKEVNFLAEVEREFRRQIETVMSKTKVTHIDSHEHIHSIPKIFDIVCRLAKEYGIKQVRTHFEKYYLVPDLQKHFNINFYKNFLRVAFLGFLAVFNEAIIHQYKLKTNDYLIGLIYDKMIDALTIAYGVLAINRKNIIVEAIIHPSRYDDGTVNNRFNEYLLTKNKKLRAKIENLGFEITNYAEEN